MTPRNDKSNQPEREPHQPFDRVLSVRHVGGAGGNGSAVGESGPVGHVDFFPSGLIGSAGRGGGSGAMTVKPRAASRSAVEASQSRTRGFRR